ncbi:NmrA family transcriptional regulator, partial [bacterium M00.F.Ca.ET.194.01.1.1]
RRAFLLNPPADPATDTDAEEQKTVAAIVTALAGSGLEKVVAESTYGAQPGEGIGDLSVLYGFEQKLKAQTIPASIIRAAYYMSNWDQALETARR